MNLEHVFAKALSDHPQSPLGVRVKRAIRQVHAKPNLQRPLMARKETRALGYHWRQLGQRWSSLRLGGCAWVGPIGRLRADWLALGREAAELGVDAEEYAELLRQVALGIGLAHEGLTCPGRTYLLRLAESLPADATDACRVPGVRFFSPFTLLIAAVHDLADHSTEERVALRCRLDEDALIDEHLDYPDQVRSVCRRLAGWGALQRR